MICHMSRPSRPAGIVSRLGAVLSERPAPTIAVAALLIAGIGVADYLTGYDLSFGLFYVAPVSMLAWLRSRKTGVLAAAVSAVVWLVANTYTAPPEIAPAIIVWNTMIRFGFFVIIAWLVATLRASHLREVEMARIDPLTGLMNSRAFREAADRELARARRTGQPITVLYLDLDKFKSVNDRRGHAAGDALLVAFARTLETAVRATDVVGRLGGDEFVVLLPDTDGEKGLVVAAKIRESVVTDDRFARDGITVSVGLATLDEPPDDIDVLVGSADEAMYRAKRAGQARSVEADSAS